jgi:hypothetical protein
MRSTPIVPAMAIAASSNISAIRVFRRIVRGYGEREPVIALSSDQSSAEFGDVALELMQTFDLANA